MSKAKRFTSREIARAWVFQDSINGRCPSAMEFFGPKFYSYSTVIAELVENHAGKAVALVSDEHYSMTTARHLGYVRHAVRVRGVKYFTVPGVRQGDSDIADFDRIFSEWQEQAQKKLEVALRSREPKKSRLIVEAHNIVEQMRELAWFFHLSLANYPVNLPMPDQKRVDKDDYARIGALRLMGNASPWMNTPGPVLEETLEGLRFTSDYAA